MSERANAELVQSFYSNVAAGDIDAVIALLSPDFTIVYSGPPVIPAAGTWNGHEGFRRWAQAALQGHLPPESLHFEEFIVHGDSVVYVGVSCVSYFFGVSVVVGAPYLFFFHYISLTFCPPPTPINNLTT
jgi:ketosteroid isomerase-like protein